MASNLEDPLQLVDWVESLSGGAISSTSSVGLVRFIESESISPREFLHLAATMRLSSIFPGLKSNESLKIRKALLSENPQYSAKQGDDELPQSSRPPTRNIDNTAQLEKTATYHNDESNTGYESNQRDISLISKSVHSQEINQSDNITCSWAPKRIDTGSDPKSLFHESDNKLRNISIPELPIKHTNVLNSPRITRNSYIKSNRNISPELSAKEYKYTSPLCSRQRNLSPEQKKNRIYISDNDDDFRNFPLMKEKYREHDNFHLGYGKSYHDHYESDFMSRKDQMYQSATPLNKHRRPRYSQRYCYKEPRRIIHRSISPESIYTRYTPFISMHKDPLLCEDCERSYNYNISRPESISCRRPQTESRPRSYRDDDYSHNIVISTGTSSSQSDYADNVVRICRDRMDDYKHELQTSLELYVKKLQKDVEVYKSDLISVLWVAINSGEEGQNREATFVALIGSILDHLSSSLKLSRRIVYEHALGAIPSSMRGKLFDRYLKADAEGNLPDLPSAPTEQIPSKSTSNNETKKAVLVEDRKSDIPIVPSNSAQRRKEYGESVKTMLTSNIQQNELPKENKEPIKIINEAPKKQPYHSAFDETPVGGQHHKISSPSKFKEQDPKENLIKVNNSHSSLNTASKDLSSPVNKKEEKFDNKLSTSNVSTTGANGPKTEYKCSMDTAMIVKYIEDFPESKLGKESKDLFINFIYEENLNGVSFSEALMDKTIELPMIPPRQMIALRNGWKQVLKEDEVRDAVLNSTKVTKKAVSLVA